MAGSFWSRGPPQVGTVLALCPRPRPRWGLTRSPSPLSERSAFGPRAWAGAQRAARGRARRGRGQAGKARPSQRRSERGGRGRGGGIRSAVYISQSAGSHFGIGVGNIADAASLLAFGRRWWQRRRQQHIAQRTLRLSSSSSSSSHSPGRGQLSCPNPEAPLWPASSHRSSSRNCTFRT